MFAWIVGNSLKYRFLLLAFSVALVVFGTDVVRQIPIDVFPEFAPPKVEIQTEGPGMTSVEVEQLITIPMEQQLRGVPGVDVVRSSSVEGLSTVYALFKPGFDLMTARQRVQERLALAIAELPKSAGMPVMLQPLSSTSRVMKIGLTSDVYDMMDLSMIAYWTIKFRLMSVPGVANIPIWGDRIKALQVLVDPDRMRAQGVTLQEVMESTSDSLDFGLLTHTAAAKTRIDGMFDTPNQRLAILHKLPVVGPDHLKQVPVRVKTKRRPVVPKLSDIGEVKWGTWPMIGDGVINDKVGLMLIVEKLPWANTLEVTHGIEKALEELRPGLGGIEIDAKIFRPATYIEDSINNLTVALIIGAILVVLVLGAFLYEWRVALISVIAIPLSLMVAALVLSSRGITINTMVLAGLMVALGSLVDDAIIDVENILRRLRENRAAGSPLSTARVILDASLEIRSAIMYATLIIALAVAPVFFMGGLSGAFFEPLAFAYVLAMLASMVVALTVTPALALVLLRGRVLEKKESPLVPWIKRHYANILTRVLSAPKRTFAGTVMIFASGIIIFPLLGESLLPSFKERDFLMHWVPAAGTSHPETFRITKQASLELRQIPGVLNFGAHIGRAVGGDEPYGVEFTENWISIDPKVDYDKTRAAVQSAVDGYPGLYRDVLTYLKERIKEVLTGSGESIVVRLYGPELPVLRKKARDVYDAIKGTEGLIDLHVERLHEIPQIRVTVNMEKAARHGLKPGEVRQVANVWLSGIEVTDIHRDNKVYDVWVWSQPESRRDIETIRELQINTPYGGVVKLGEVANVDLVPTPNAIKHENTHRRIDVHANVRGRDLGSVARDVERKLKTVSFPLGYYPELLGEYKERQKAQENLLWASIFTSIGIFLLLYMSFRSMRLACLTFLALPAALVGGVLAAFAGSGILSLGSLVGFLTVLGIAARNGILLIHHYQHLEREEGEPFGIGLIMRGASERLIPILMTTLSTGLAMAPLAITGNLPGYEIEHPMAIVILGGLVTSTMLTLLVVPLLYRRFGAGTALRGDDEIYARQSVVQ